MNRFLASFFQDCLVFSKVSLVTTKPWLFYPILILDFLFVFQFIYLNFKNLWLI